MTDYNISFLVILSFLFIIIGRMNALSLFWCFVVIFLSLLSIPFAISLQYFLGKRKAFTYTYFISHIYSTFVKNIKSLFKSPWHHYFLVAVIITILPLLIIFLTRDLR